MYQVTYWKRDPDQRCHLATDRRTVGTLKAARLFAADRLEPLQTTRALWHDILGRADHVSIYDMRGVARDKRDARPDEGGPVYVDTISPEVDLVPSVGELGYW
jgi:hypothetical protein